MQIQQPTCFIRAIRNEDEICFIKSNEDRIRRIITKSNPSNKIVYLCPNSMKAFINFSNVYFTEKYDGTSRTTLRSLFDTNNELIQYCINNIKCEQRLKNVIFDSNKQTCDFNKQIEVMKSRYELALNMANSSWKNLNIIKGKLIIYGAGEIGKLLLDKIDSQIDVIYFIDEYSEEEEYKAIPIKRLKETGNLLSDNEDISIVITPIHAYESIRKRISNILGVNVNIISLEDII